MIQKYLILFFCFQFHLICNAAVVEIDIRFIDHEELLPYNFDARNYARYQKAFQDSITIFFNDSEAEQNIKIIQTLDPNLYPFYSFTAKPRMVDSTQHQLQKLLMSIHPITALHLPFSSEITVTINGGCKNRGLDYTPQLTKPLTLRQSKYEYASFEQCYTLLQNWIFKEAYPILIKIHNAHVRQEKIELTEAEQNAFSTVSQGMGVLLRDDMSKKGVYWSILQKMNPNDRTLMLFKTMSDANEGRIDYAQKSLQMLYQFEANNSVLRYLMDELNWRLQYYRQKENAIMQNVSTTYTEANLGSDLKTITEVLKINYMSSSALNRLFTFESEVGQKSSFPTITRSDYQRSDPMRLDTVNATTPGQAYSNYLKKSALEMFIDAETFESDFSRYAEIALKLRAYEFAANLYWLLKHQSGKIDEKIYEEYDFRYNYAIHKLNPEQEVSKKLKKQIKRLDKKFRKEKKKHPQFKNFKN